uniref:tRNA-intron lyase n=1 Tax=Anopheles atroparvus TaxID=41427 RepID=A0AAG5D925_ANOAO
MAVRGKLFVHNLRAKKHVPSELSQTLPLPLHDGKLSGLKTINAIFTGFSVDVTDDDSIRELCLNGGFGQGMFSRAFPARLTCSREPGRKQKRKCPVSNINASRSDSGSNTSRLDDKTRIEPLCLFLEEAFFLMHQLNMLKLKTIDDETISVEEAFNTFQRINKGFFAGYCAYLYLKSKNWIIKSGMKFGGDFVIYVKGPQFYHASYIVLVQEMYRGKQLGRHVMDGLDFQGFNRVAETTAKDILFLEVHHPDSLDLSNGVDCLEKIKDVRVAEMFTKHHNYIASRNMIDNK